MTHIANLPVIDLDCYSILAILISKCCIFKTYFEPMYFDRKNTNSRIRKGCITIVLSLLISVVIFSAFLFLELYLWAFILSIGFFITHSLYVGIHEYSSMMNDIIKELRPRSQRSDVIIIDKEQPQQKEDVPSPDHWLKENKGKTLNDYYRLFK